MNPIDVMPQTRPIRLEDASLRVDIDPVSGAVASLVLPDDPHAMNWVTGTGDSWHPAGNSWGLGHLGAPLREQVHLRRWQRATHVASTGPAQVVSHYLVDDVSIRVTRRLQDGALLEHYELRNLGDATLDVGRLSVFVPFRTDLTDGSAGLDRHAHAHVHATGARTWVCALRMSGRGDHLGLALTEGSAAGYTLDGASDLTGSAVRGDLALTFHDTMQTAGTPGSRPLTLAPGSTIAIAWTVFRHTGRADFERRRHLHAPGPELDLPHGTTTTVGTPLPLTVPPGTHALVRDTGTNDWTPIPVDSHGRITLVRAEPGLVDVAVGNPLEPAAFATVGFLLDLDELTGRRSAFIAARQQVDDPSSPLHGALLPYDNRAGGIVRSTRPDLNEGRERLGMGVLLAQASAHHSDLRAAVERYEHFVANHLQDLDGTVHDSATDRTRLRLYNYPWVARFWLQCFELSGSTAHLDRFVRTVRNFYAAGGYHFYPIALPVLRGIDAVRRADRPDVERQLLNLFRRHGHALLEHGTAYPTSEVPYEQSIVAPAAAILLELALVTGDDTYADGARAHLHLLEQFDGHQPDARTHGVPIRHWDGYWFGIDPIWGDTMPHHWAAQSAWVYGLASRVWDDPDYARRARTTSRATLLTFFADGSASCAYSNPLSVNGARGARWDPLANDQDWALVTALDLRDLLDNEH
ncbi:hypothetical protein [Cellulomonas endophytica]|uniref:hypothetical protein n=1 Tax=Cellulomonas endophytica TaxID=2494735 RepID=UPI0010131A68|nr:hypothetical protein [Cellulomonas endophytica]